ncbi:MAG TPA: KH domain-containing protein [Thermotogaceae bacterium]|nr:KH domain-containing protein [Thermotogota bacterium]HEW91278.1 KH domain-containing protein [Thermotogaceae bacterium]
MKEVLEYIIKGIVKNPEDVKIVELVEENSKVFEVFLNDEDVGQVIGKDGRTIKSINILLNALAGPKNEKYVLRVIR